jgi:hypothetical protein
MKQLSLIKFEDLLAEDSQIRVTSVKRKGKSLLVSMMIPTNESQGKTTFKRAKQTFNFDTETTARTNRLKIQKVINEANQKPDQKTRKNRKNKNLFLKKPEPKQRPVEELIKEIGRPGISNNRHIVDHTTLTSIAQNPKGVDSITIDGTTLKITFKKAVVLGAEQGHDVAIFNGKYGFRQPESSAYRYWSKEYKCHHPDLTKHHAMAISNASGAKIKHTRLNLPAPRHQHR